MKVTLINASDAGGGAPAACMRLLKALQFKQVDVNLLVQEKKTGDDHVFEADPGFWGNIKRNYRFYAERIKFILFQAKEKPLWFAFSTAKKGINISKKPLIKNADVLHLHWINHGFQSINNLKKLLRLGKPVVWTLHDMWAFTGGCHYAGDCDHFTHHCGHCRMLRDPQATDISYKGWTRKMHLFHDKDSIVFITCSNWLAGVARKSPLLEGYRIEAIPNPIDTTLFSPQNKNELRAKRGIAADKKIILFGAANILDRRKGFRYLAEALDLMNDDPESAEIEIVIFGKNKDFDVKVLPFKVYEAGIVSSEKDMAVLYALSDVYVTPAIEDNLPNTVMEALSCGTPVVAFNTGGIPDMVDHLDNGYLAEYKSPVDLAAGIRFVLTNRTNVPLALNARDKVLQNFSYEIVAGKYMDVYQSLLN